MSLSALIFAIAFLSSDLFLILFGFFTLAIILAAWFRDLLPSLLAGSHPWIVQFALIYGFILFLLSEIFLFFSFFWAYFNSALIPGIELGLWPPIGVESIDPWSIPLMGTLILLSSGATATLAHYGSLSGDKALVLFGLLITILLGIGFIALQLNEYLLSGFSIADSLFHSI
jgi:heme/copper-type cytochrome/quinol oxidase subunit 3